MVRRVSVAALALASFGCSQTPRTQVMLVIDTDITNVDTLYVEASSPEGRMQIANAFVGPSEPPLPRVLGLAQQTSGRLGPFTVRVTAREGSRDRYTRTLRFDFQPRRTLQLHVALPASCITTRCEPDETCAEAGCRPILVAAPELTEWTGDPTPAPLILAMPDGGV